MENKKHLIYKEDLIAEYDRVHIGPPGGARKLMEGAPAVDAVEVVRGHWEHIFEDARYQAKCTACGRVATTICIAYCSPSFRINWHYCPNCGAKMDGDI